MFIREAELLRGMPEHIHAEISGISTEEALPEGHELFKQGDSADFLYILAEGLVEITVQGEERITFSVADPDSVFGWSALVEPRQYTAGARCKKMSRVVKIDGDRLMRVFQHHPVEGLGVMSRLAGIIAGRLVNCYDELTKSERHLPEVSY
jgi:CRP-like cAMP-binding protein